jgi:hypothetical protein
MEKRWRATVHVGRKREMELAMIPASRNPSCLAKSQVDFNNSRIPAYLHPSSPTTYNGVL